ncbi:hypothetical protein KO02_06565 [Sphingobacterium sp. ML3W]|uniref:hypothetical protein n=1 Tax=Sphingobacterium sp. ML3W TaxID=1538644 RepID=UPI0004F88CB4|nr:hypothetical protein [Sphingobacterium sp. ML3W]AIM36399.1 hypothetical protein KO02_06565 [Sphingobacterium sp. ML3W]
MKLSSKILIGLGITFFVIPIVMTSYIAGDNRVDSKVYEEILRKEGNDPKSEDTYLKTYHTNSFRNLKINGNQKGAIALFIVKSDQYAVKVDKNSEREVLVVVDGNGQLNIELTDNAKSYYKRIYIFTPDIKQIELSEVRVNNFSGQCDQLEIFGNKIEDFTFDSNVQINALSLRLKNSLISGDRQQSFNLDQLTLDLDSSDVNIAKQNYEDVFIQAKDSKVNFSGENPDAKLKFLNLKTVGNTSIGLGNLQVENIEGQLSQETKTDLPVSLLRKIIK